MERDIDHLQRIAAERPEIVALGGGLPSDRLFPRAALARAFVGALAEPSASALQYSWPEGSERLRGFVAARLRARGAAVVADDVVMTSGAQQALALAAAAVLAAGDVVGTDAETYPAALDVFRARGAAPRAGGAGKALYLMPAVGNPRGVAISEEARARALAGGAYLIEDDAYAELRFDGRLLEPLLAAGPARDRTFHVGSFSKTLAPGLRVGWLVPPPALRERVLEEKHAQDLQSSSLGQAILERFLAADDWDARLARARRFYAGRAERLLAALRRHLPGLRAAAPEGGFAVYVESDEPGDEKAFLETATAHGVSFDPGRIFRPEPRPDAPLAFRLCFSAVPPRDLEEGVRRLTRAWAARRR